MSVTYEIIPAHQRVIKRSHRGVSIALPLANGGALLIFGPPEGIEGISTEFSARIKDVEVNARTVRLVGPSQAVEALTRVFQEMEFEVRSKILSDTCIYDFMADTVTGSFKIAPIDPVKLLVVDDSPTIRKMLHAVVKEIGGIEIIGETGDPLEVQSLIERLKPQVMSLDINMPKMNGDELLRQIFPASFVPTLILSSLEMGEGGPVLGALEAGAIDYMMKPSANDIKNFANQFSERIHLISRAKSSAPVTTRERRTTRFAQTLDQDQIFLIGASTGGTEAIREVLVHLPSEIPPILIVQHIPPHFSKAFADRLNQLCPFEVREAKDGDEVKKNLVLVAPGGKQMKLVRRSSGNCYVEINDDPPMTGHRPSVDYLFHSAVAAKVKNTVSLLMTGMGKDGAQGLKALREAGSRTLAQDEASCVVYGMPRAAVQINAAEQVVSLHDIPEVLSRFSNKKVA